MKATRAHLPRRVVSVPGLLALTVLVTLTLPITFLAATVADVSSGGRQHHRRVLLFVHQALLIESGGVLASGWAWLLAGLGTRLDRPASIRRHYQLQQWWVTRLLDRAERHLGLRMDVTASPGAAGPIIVLPRHVCIGDALVPSILFGGPRRRPLRYVLKAGLRWGPCLDIVGHRVPTVFVDRSTADPAQRGAIRELAAGAGDGGIVVFPEGTFHTPARADRAQARLRQDDPGRAERLERLRHVLPPRPGGTLAALAGAPTADVHVVAHVGFEGMATLADLYRTIPLDEPVEVEVWRIPRAEIPADPADQVRWLDEVWLELDAWVDARQDERRG